MDVEQWNILDCPRPPVATSKATLTDLPKNGKGQSVPVGVYLNRTAKKIEEMIAYLKSPAGSELFKTEAYLVSRLYYKAACIYRWFRVKQTMRQLRNCLTRLDGLNIQKSFEEFLEVWPRSTKGDNVAYIPRVEMLQYLLVRLMGGARLLMQTCAYCHHGFHEVMFNFHLGFFVPQMLVLGACFGRIWALCHSFRKRFEEWFDILLEVKKHLPEAQSDWLQMEIPERLSDWLPPDPDLPSDDLADFEKAVRKSRTVETKSREIEMLEDSVDEPAVGCHGDDLGLPVARSKVQKRLNEFEDEEMGISQEAGMDDFGSPVVRSALKRNVDEIDSGYDTVPRKKLKKNEKKKAKLAKKLLKNREEIGALENENGCINEMTSGNSEQETISPKKEKKITAKKKKKKVLRTKINESTDFENNLQDGMKLSKKKKKKLKNLAVSPDNHVEIVAIVKKSKSPKKMKKKKFKKTSDVNGNETKKVSPDSHVEIIDEKNSKSPKKKKLKKNSDVNGNETKNVSPDDHVEIVDVQNSKSPKKMKTKKLKKNSDVNGNETKQVSLKKGKKKKLKKLSTNMN